MMVSLLRYKITCAYINICLRVCLFISSHALYINHLVYLSMYMCKLCMFEAKLRIFFLLLDIASFGFMRFFIEISGICFIYLNSLVFLFLAFPREKVSKSLVGITKFLLKFGDALSTEDVKLFFIKMEDSFVQNVCPKPT